MSIPGFARLYSSVVSTLLLLQSQRRVAGERPVPLYETYGDYWDLNINNQILVQKRDNKLVGAFNLDYFNLDKLSRPIVQRILPLIIRRYDLIMVSGIFDKDQTAIKALLAMVNDKNLSPYGMNVSAPENGGPTKEQFGIFYKKLRYDFLDFTVYEDTKKLFRRPPVAASIKYKFAPSAPGFALVHVHLRPKFAKEEMNSLHEVTEWAKQKFSVEDVLISGDFRSGCDNLMEEDWANITLWTMPEYIWVTPKDLITTIIGEKPCAHEKIVLTGQWLEDHTYVTSGRVFHFDRAYNLDKAETWQVSRNYPVEVVMSAGATDGNE